MDPPPPTTHNSTTPAEHKSHTMRINNDTKKTNLQTTLHKHTSNENTTKVYNLRSRKTQHQTIIPCKRKQHRQKHHQQVRLSAKQPEPTPTPIKWSSAAQAPSRINMAFPAPCTMPRNNPPIPATHTQPTLEKYFYPRAHKQETTTIRKPQTSTANSEQGRRQHNLSTPVHSRRRV